MTHAVYHPLGFPQSKCAKLLSIQAVPAIIVVCVIPPKGQEFLFAFVEPHEGPVSPFLQTTEGPLNSGSALRSVSLLPQPDVIHKLA